MNPFEIAVMCDPLLTTREMCDSTGVLRTGIQSILRGTSKIAVYSITIVLEINKDLNS